MAYDSGDYNRGGMRAFVFAMVFTTVFFIYIAFFHPGVNLNEVPQATDGQTAAPAPQAAADAPKAFDPSSVKEPWVSTPELVAHGKSLYTTNCQFCHGNEGKGDGPAGTGLVPPPRDIVKGEWKKGGSQVDLYNVVTNGIQGTSMAAYGHLPDVDRWALVHFVQSITQNKVDKPDQLKAFLAERK